MAKNAIFLYFRMCIIMLVTLYTSRVILRSLGETDYGVYSVIGGVVAMLGLFSASLSTATTRFLAFYLAKGDINRLQKVFSTSLLIHWLLVIIIVIIAETVGVWFLNFKMEIPAERMEAANWVLQGCIVVFVINFISIPYNAVIIARERMKVFAYIGILEAFLKLLVALLLYLSVHDKLIFYILLLVGIALILRIIYGFYCYRHFAECRARLSWDRSSFYEMIGYSSWQIIGSSSALFRDQGGNVILNLFFGTAANAAMGIAMQIKQAIQLFLININQAINPQIFKSYASGEKEYFMKLIYVAARFPFYLMLLIGLPILLETQYILHLWLGDYPDYTISFVRLFIIFALVDSLNPALSRANEATGVVRAFQLIGSGLQLLCLPISYLLLTFEYPAESLFITFIVIAICCFFIRTWMLRLQIGLPVIHFCRHVVGNIFLVTLLSIPIPFFFLQIFPEGLMRFLLVVAVAVFFTFLSIYFIGCSRSERLYIVQKVKSIIRRKYDFR